MKKVFYIAIVGIILFEVANVYFIMPLPGSQRMNSVGFAYMLSSMKWIIRAVLYAMLMLGLVKALRGKWILATAMLVLASGVTWMFNFKMTASAIFKEMIHKNFATVESNKVDTNKLVIAVEFNGDARAYPIQYIAYHHRVFDTVGGKIIMVTYCSACRTGRVIEPIVNGKREAFRLVGMDHFNAMFEDKTTHSWWRQENGEAIAGKLKGEKLPVLPSVQMSLADWIKIYPKGKILQADTSFVKRYKNLEGFDVGTRKSSLEGTDSASWNEKSWVIGILDESNISFGANHARAYDWNLLKKKRVIGDTFNNKKIVIWISKNDKSFFAFYLPSKVGSEDSFRINTDNSLQNGEAFIIYPNGMLGWRHSGKTEPLKPVAAYQEFWHSWRIFHGNARYLRK